MKISLATIAEIMEDGGFCKQNGECISFNDGYFEKCRETDIYIPAVNYWAIADEFIIMQNFPSQILTTYKYDSEYPIQISQENIEKFIHRLIPPNNNKAMSEYLSVIGMEYELCTYIDMRIAGLARKWCIQNEFEIIEDYPIYRWAGAGWSPRWCKINGIELE